MHATETTFSKHETLLTERLTRVRIIVLGGTDGIFCSGLKLCRIIPTSKGMAEREGELKRAHSTSSCCGSRKFVRPPSPVDGPAVAALRALGTRALVIGGEENRAGVGRRR